MKNRVGEPPQVASRAQHAKVPSTEESLASNGLRCVLAVVPQVRRELPGIRLLTKAWLLARDSSVEGGLAEICYLLSPTLATSLGDLSSARTHARHVSANTIGLPRGTSHIKLIFQQQHDIQTHLR